ncbi:reverse transcriptase-like protein [Brevibacillus nitrificans]|uniref:reverse transcriptase-like protein n=1 Tax=Brevibacillus nitrificans TaxID=651560 RepID=UPI0026073BE6|nr:reverse transcriptase-like protein [Brevibacillus nitrificans]
MYEVYFDGASAGNPGPSGAGIFMKKNGEVERYSIPLGNMDNHEAEFRAFLIALQLCKDKGYSQVSFRTDSQLVSQAVEKEFVKNKRFVPLLAEALTLIRPFDLFFIKWVPSSENKAADELARAAIRNRKSKEEAGENTAI